MTHSPQHIARSAEGLTDGAKRACLRMTEEWQFPGKATFDANGAWALSRAQSGFGALAEQRGDWRRSYRLTPLGLAVRDHLQEQAMTEIDQLAAAEVDDVLYELDELRVRHDTEIPARAAAVIRAMRAEHRRLHAAETAAAVRVLELEGALIKAHALISSIEQSPGDVWFVGGEDPEIAVCDAHSAVEDALRKGSGFTFPPGTAVRKVKGYLWPGVVVAAFRTLAGQERYVVECTAEAVAGALHIYNPDQLEVADA